MKCYLGHAGVLLYLAESPFKNTQKTDLEKEIELGIFSRKSLLF